MLEPEALRQVAAHQRKSADRPNSRAACRRWSPPMPRTTSRRSWMRTPISRSMAGDRAKPQIAARNRTLCRSRSLPAGSHAWQSRSARGGVEWPEADRGEPVGGRRHRRDAAMHEHLLEAKRILGRALTSTTRRRKRGHKAEIPYGATGARRSRAGRGPSPICTQSSSPPS